MNLLRKIYYMLTPKMRFLVRYIVYLPIDLFDRLTGTRNKMIPPRGMMYIGSGDFELQGKRILSLVKRYTHLQPNHQVLDVGCGIGRFAIPLTSFLSTNGTYEGFDIVKTGIDWCTKHISPSYPHFHFSHIDLNNTLYNTATTAKAEQFTFPYSDSYFDIVVLTSVFTHMMPNDVDNYLAQISRVLKPDGMCYATFFLFNKQEQTPTTGRSFTFNYDYGHYRLLDEIVTEANIAFDESYINMLANKHHLCIKNEVPGWWRGSEKTSEIDFQDIIIFQKIHPTS
jgi:ubiquinone/menaquinone biosynthesis C-methylase UbiE